MISSERSASPASRMLDEFHAALGDKPGREGAAIRMALHEEEHGELIDALYDCSGCPQQQWPDGKACDDCRRALARELADVVYVAFGTAHAFDLDLDAALREVHRAAMSKVIRSNGEPPDMTEAISSRELGDGLAPAVPNTGAAPDPLPAGAAPTPLCPRCRQRPAVIAGHCESCEEIIACIALNLARDAEL